MNLKSKTTGLALFLTIVIGFTVIMTATAPSSQGPYIDEQWFKIIKSPDTQVIALTTHDVDAGAVPLPEYIPNLKAADFTITSTVKLGYNMLFMNNIMYPADDLEMRKVIIRLVDKDALDELMAPVSRHIEYWLPESMPQWINPNAKLPLYDPVEADVILNAAGYVYSTVPTPAGWYDPDVPGSQPFYRIDPDTGLPMERFEYVTRPYAESPLYYELSLIINDRFHAMGIPSDLTPKSWMDIVYILINSDFEDYPLLSGISVVWGSPAPDVMYAFFESSQKPLWNFWNFENAACDAACAAMRDTLLPATLSTAVNNIQLIANSEIPYVPLMQYLTYEAFTGPYFGNPDGATKIVNMRGVGATGVCPSDALAFGTLPITNEWGKEYGESGRIEGGKHIHKSYLGGEIDTLNPLMANTIPDWATLDMITGDFVRLNPYTHKYMWRAATGMPITVQWKYKVGEKKAKKWVTGMTLDYTLRDDLKWQDGMPVTAADCVFALNLMRFQENERYYYVWQPIYDVVQTGPYSFKIWWRDRYLYAHEYFGISLLCPKHIWEDWIDSPGTGEPLVINYGAGPKGGDVWTSVGRHHSGFDLWDVAHPTDPTLTCLVGTDNFIYRDAGWDPGVAVYVDAWKNADNYMDRILTGDCNLDQFVDSSDSWHLLYRQGDFTGQCYPTAIGGHPRWDPIADIAYPAQKITGDEYVAYNNDYGQSWGP